MKYTVESNLSRKVFYFGSQFREKSIMAWKASHEAVGHTAWTVRKQKTVNTGLS